MSYQAVMGARRAAPRRAPSGLGAIVLGFVIPTASGATGTPQQVDISTVFGDYGADPLVAYMGKFHPLGLSSGVSTTFAPAVRDAMVELGYGGQPLAVLNEAAFHAAAAIAERITQPMVDMGMDASMAMLQTVPVVATALIPVVAELAAMKKPLTALKFPPGMAACAKAGGKYDAATNKCILPQKPLKFPPGMAACVAGGGHWDAASAACSAAPRTTTWAAPPPSAPSYTLYYVAAAAAVLGLGAYVLTRAKS